MSETPNLSAPLIQRSSPWMRRWHANMPALFRLVVRTLALSLIVSAGLSVLMASTATAAEKRHGFSVFGDLKYGPDFERFDYASPKAVKGGSVTLGTIGTFDSLNPFILKGVAAAGAALIYDTLAVQSLDEPYAVYGAVAESMEVADDKRWVIFNLRREARWHDGVALTAEDVVWTFDTIKERGHPYLRSYYSAIATAEAIDTHTVKFSFSEGNNPELPLIIAELPIMPKHYWADREFDKTSLEPPLGSGPYRISKVDPGRSISYERVEDYWGESLPVHQGENNFDTLRYDYYRDLTVALEALKSGDVDFRLENTAKNWTTAYDFPAVTDGRVIKAELPDHSIKPMQAIIFNLRDPKFQDIRVRQALAYPFDFEWLNKNLFYDAYQRTMSYFQNSDMQATGLPEGEELKILERFRDQLPASVFTEEFSLPTTDGSGNLRKQYRTALGLFKEAGWEVKNGKMTNVDTGEVFTMEMILRQPGVEKIGLAYKKTLERIGVDLKVRVIDSAQYEKRLEDFDFDITTHIWLQTQSPGNEQVDYWGSANADIQGSRNVMGVKNPVVDEIVKLIIAADSRDEQVAATRALDRVLLHNHYSIPQYFSPNYRVAYWNKFGRPDIVPDNALGFGNWWVDPALDTALDQ